MFTYAAKLNRVIDGDTVVLDIDLGFHIVITEHVRIIGVDSPERGTPLGRLAKAFSEDWFNRLAGACVVVTAKGQPRSFTRWVGSIGSPDGTRDLTADLIAAGHVKREDTA